MTISVQVCLTLLLLLLKVVYLLLKNLGLSVSRQKLNKHQQLFLYENSRYFISVLEQNHLWCNLLLPFALIIMMMIH